MFYIENTEKVSKEYQPVEEENEDDNDFVFFDDKEVICNGFSKSNPFVRSLNSRSVMKAYKGKEKYTSIRRKRSREEIVNLEEVKEDVTDNLFLDTSCKVSLPQEIQVVEDYISSVHGHATDDEDKKEFAKEGCETPGIVENSPDVITSFALSPLKSYFDLMIMSTGQKSPLPEFQKSNNNESIKKRKAISFTSPKTYMKYTNSGELSRTCLQNQSILESSNLNLENNEENKPKQSEKSIFSRIGSVVSSKKQGGYLGLSSLTPIPYEKPIPLNIESPSFDKNNHKNTPEVITNSIFYADSLSSKEQSVPFGTTGDSLLFQKEKEKNSFNNTSGSGTVAKRSASKKWFNKKSNDTKKLIEEDLLENNSDECNISMRRLHSAPILTKNFQYDSVKNNLTDKKESTIKQHSCSKKKMHKRTRSQDMSKSFQNDLVVLTREKSLSSEDVSIEKCCSCEEEVTNNITSLNINLQSSNHPKEPIINSSCDNTDNKRLEENMRKISNLYKCSRNAISTTIPKFLSLTPSPPDTTSLIPCDLRDNDPSQCQNNNTNLPLPSSISHMSLSKPEIDTNEATMIYISPYHINHWTKKTKHKLSTSMVSLSTFDKSIGLSVLMLKEGSTRVKCSKV